MENLVKDASIFFFFIIVVLFDLPCQGVQTVVITVI